jgi:hypothetical protein
MSNQLKTFRENDYQNQKEIYLLILNYLRKYQTINDIFIKSEFDPVNSILKIEKELGINEAYKSVKMGINDILDWTKYLPNNEVIEIDEMLKSKKIETLTQLRDKNFKKIKKIIQKKEITNEIDYYLLINILNDENYFTMNENYRERINILISSFEARKGKI